MIIWPKLQIFQRYPIYPTNENNTMKTTQTPKKSPQQFLTKLNPLVKKSINNPTTLEFCLKTLKNIRRTNHFLNVFFSITVDHIKQKHLNLSTKFFNLFKCLIFFFIETFESLIIISIIFCIHFLIFYSLFEVYLQLSQILDHIYRYEYIKSI